MAPVANIAGVTQNLRSYQPRPERPSKQMTKLNRYMLNGTIQSSGIEATFCVIWFVPASSNVAPRAEQPIQYTYRPSDGGASSERVPPVSSMCRSSGTRRLRHA